MTDQHEQDMFDKMKWAALAEAMGVLQLASDLAGDANGNPLAAINLAREILDKAEAAINAIERGQRAYALAQRADAEQAKHALHLTDETEDA